GGRPPTARSPRTVPPGCSLASRLRRSADLLPRRGGPVGLRLELVEEAVDDALTALLVGEGLPDDALGEVRRQHADVGAQGRRGLLALGLDVPLGALEDAVRLRLGLGLDVGRDDLRVVLGLLADVGRLDPRLGELTLDVGAQRLGLGPGVLAGLEAALDLLRPLVEDPGEDREDLLDEEEGDDRDADDRPDDVVVRRDEGVLSLLRRSDQSRGHHQNTKPAAKPIRPRASTRAAPMNMLTRSGPATSG